MNDTERQNPAASKLSVADCQPLWLKSVVDKLAELKALSENWNSYGSRRIDPVAAKAVIDILSAVAPEDIPMPAVVPTVRGTIQLEWHARGVDLEVDVRSPTDLVVCYEDHQTGETWDTVRTGDATLLKGPLASLASRV